MDTETVSNDENNIFLMQQELSKLKDALLVAENKHLDLINENKLNSSTLRKIIEEKNEEIKSLSDKIMEYMQDLSAAEEELKAIKSSAELVREKENSSRKITAENEDAISSKSIMEMLKQQEEVLKEKEKMIETLNEKHRLSEIIISSYHKQIEEKNNNLNTMNSKICNYKAELTRKSDNILKMTRENQEAFYLQSKEIKELQETIINLRQTIADQAVASNKMEEQLKQRTNLEENKNDLPLKSNEVINSQTSYSSLVTSFQNCLVSEEILEHELLKLNKRHNETLKTLKTSEEQMKTKEELIETLKLQIANLQNSYQEEIKSYETLKENIKFMESRIELFQTELTSTIELKQQLEVKIKSERKIMDASPNILKLEKKVIKLEAKYDNCLKNLYKKECDLTKMEKETKNLKCEFKELQEKYTEKEESLKEAMATIKELQTENENYIKNNRTLKESFEFLKCELLTIKNNELEKEKNEERLHDFSENKEEYGEHSKAGSSNSLNNPENQNYSSSEAIINSLLEKQTEYETKYASLMKDFENLQNKYDLVKGICRVRKQKLEELTNKLVPL